MDPLTPELLASPYWTDEQAAGFETVDVPFVTVGGGFGSLMVVDLLRIAGLGTESIAVLTRNEYPHESYQFLARNSQIRDQDRLRSDSSAMPDNAWGFPSFALREARHGNVGQVFRVMGEPLWSEFFTPVSGDVFAGVRSEADRIGWNRMTRFGQVRLVRPRIGGGYFTVLTIDVAGEKRRIAFRSRYVHMAPGYGGAQFLPDLQEYRQESGDVIRVVNAYENHEHVYLEARRRPVTVLVRGSGIVGSRVINRLLNDREQGLAHTNVVHLFRRYPTPSTDGGRHPEVRLGFIFQPFNLCKGMFGGNMAEEIEQMPDPQDRVDAIVAGAGTTTAKRREWYEQLDRGVAHGYYRQHVGQVTGITGDHDGLHLSVEQDGNRYALDVDFIIDSTGLQGGVRDQRILTDLIDVVGVSQNPMGRMLTDRHFEMTEMQAAPGRCFITGAMSNGNYFGPVDSFYGLQWAAWRVVDRMAEDGFIGRIGSGRSVAQWIRRMRGVAP